MSGSVYGGAGGHRAGGAAVGGGRGCALVNVLEPQEAWAPPRLLLTPLEAARALAISPRSLCRLTRKGAIPTVRAGRLVRYSVADLQAWVTRQTQATDAPKQGM